MKNFLTGQLLAIGVVSIALGEHTDNNIIFFIGLCLLIIYHSIMWERGNKR